MTWIRDLQPRRSSAIACACFVTTLLVGLPRTGHSADNQSQGGGLFSPVKSSEFREFRSAAMTRPNDITIRRREVTIDFGMLESSRATASGPTDTPSKLTLNLFDDTVLTAIVDRTAPTSSGYSLSGRIEGVEFGTVTLVVNGTVVAGSVRTPAGTYRITSVGRLYAISEVDESKRPPVD